MTEEETKELEAFIFVNRRTHLKIVCTCPECGTTFFNWLQGGHAMDIETIKMEMATTDCTYCKEESLMNDEDDEDDEA